MPDRSHIVRSYEEELSQLRSMMDQMGGMVESQVSLALSSVMEGDEEAAHQVVQHDHDVDMLEIEVEKLAIRLLALRGPMARDLREIVASMKISGDLERIGDYATSIARRSRKIEQRTRRVALTSLHAMGRLVQDNLRCAIDTISQGDEHGAVSVWQSDKAVDDYYGTLFRDLIDAMAHDPRHIRIYTELLFISKHLERIGDHTTNIAERVFFVVTGENLPTTRPRGKNVNA